MHWVIPGLHAIHSPFEEHPNDNLQLRKLLYNQALITCGSELYSAEDGLYLRVNLIPG